MLHRAVIGALFGDEGKGKQVEFFAHEAMRDHGACMVIRSNGGAQAAHTVQLPNGTRHVFHHFGSGTLSGASTYWSRFAITNPILFNREWDTLANLGVSPIFFISPYSIVTFPQDMLINQMLETMRGDAKHGSCGLGIGETMERVEKGRLTYRVGQLPDLVSNQQVRAQVWNELLESFDARMADLNLTEDQLPEEYMSFIRDFSIFETYIEETKKMLDRVSLVPETDIDISNPIIFEGAQGLALDRDMGFFPYVTRSKTGLFNIAQLCEEMNITDLEAVFVMRAYTTRHGAGPLDGEDIPMSGYELSDPTNKPNDWQGTLRFAPLDLWLAKRMIDLDMDAIRNRKVSIERTIAVTCLDQVPDLVNVFLPARYQTTIERNLLPYMIGSNLRAKRGFVSSGPTRDDVIVMDNLDDLPNFY